MDMKQGIYDLMLRCDDTDTAGTRKACPGGGYFYEVLLNGEPLSRSRSNPETNACRELLRRGMTGKARFWRANRTAPDLVMDIERAAKVQLVEDDKGGFRWRRYREFPQGLWLPENPSAGTSAELAQG
jgi:hypothetical protein